MTGEAIVRSELGAMVKVADALGDAGPMLPKHITSKGAALAVIMAGDELGIPPMAALRGLFLVNGKVGMDYSLMVGLLRRAGYKVQWREKTAERAELLLTHPDGSTHTEVWDVERAKGSFSFRNGHCAVWSSHTNSENHVLASRREELEQRLGAERAAWAAPLAIRVLAAR